MNDPVGQESSDCNGDSYRKHCIEIVTMLSGCCIDENRREKDEEHRAAFIELGVPEEWIEPLHELGYETIESLKEIGKSGKLANDLNGYNKKNKLGLKGVSPEEVAAWLG